MPGNRSCALPCLRACREAKAGGFWAHIAGTAYKMVVEHAVAGLRIDNYRTTLPFKKGLSSSAAVCVAVSHQAHASC
jgi:shikimate kinase